MRCQLIVKNQKITAFVFQVYVS